MKESILTKMNLKSRPTIQSLKRGLMLLDYIVCTEEPVSLTTLANMLGIEKSSTHRLLATLIEYGYIVQDSHKRYLPGHTIMELACKVSSRFEIHKVATPFLTELSERTGETAHLGIYRDDKVILTHCVSSHHTLAITSRVGSSEPLHCTALGKALICDYDKKKLREIFGCSRLKKYTSKTITSLAKLEIECRRIKDEGVAIDDEEFRIGIRCLAAPVRDFSRQIIASIGISGPKNRLDDRTFRRMKTTVKNIGIKMSNEMGYSG